MGSTAVPGLAAKPTIDMMAGLGDIGRVGDLLEPLAGIGYAYRAEGEIPGWHYFDKGKRPRRFHLHVVAIGSEFWDLHLLFRDLLRRDRSVAREYEALKRRLAREFAADRPGYNLAKTDFIQAAERRARIERASGGPPAASAQRQDVAAARPRPRLSGTTRSPRSTGPLPGWCRRPARRP